MKDYPTVVALIAAYNAGDYLLEAVHSLLAQTRPLDRIVVIDDGSTDHSIATLESLVAEGKVEVSVNEKNMGRAASVNRRFEEIDADYFVLLDADDVALPQRVERQLAFMEANPRLGCSSSFIEYISGNGRKVGKGKLDLLTEDRFEEYLFGGDPFGLFCPAVILRSDVVKDPNLRFRGEFWPADDVDLWNRIAESGWLVLAQPEILLQYRVHSSSAVTSSFVRTRMKFEWLRACLRARRMGRAEPSESEFIRGWNAAPWLTRLNRSRKIRAKGFYRGAGFDLAERRLGGACCKGAVAFLLQPSYALRRVLTQVVSSKS